VLRETFSTVVGETLRQAARDTEPLINIAQEKSTSIRRDVTTVECRLYLATPKPLEFDLI
jgi:hypothetical protein